MHRNIMLYVCLENSKRMEILSKPVVLNYDKKILGINENDFEFVDYVNNCGRIYPLTHIAAKE